MLPAPVTFTKSNPLRRSPILHPCRLPFLLLLLLCSISLLLNAFYMYQKNHLCISSAFSATVTRRVTIRGLNHLIIVPGHAIWKGGDPRLRLDNDQWLLEPYQKSGRRVAAFFAHIERGAELARNDGASLLVFSGGQTRLLSTTTEAQSYMALATSADVFHSPAPFLRATTEDYALDSFQNLLFSIARFHEYTGHYPIEITVVGYEFKRLRFIDLHRTAIRWPIQRFHYIGIDPEDGHNLTAAEEGERESGYLPFSNDSYGCHSILLAKRRQRNPFVRFHSYYTSCPELQSLFDWCPTASDGGEAALFKGDLPWD